jgi:PAS domain S-box-containing protein/putative nucleotidyltransferase with HDIG domain
MKKKELRILIIEDVPSDAELLEFQLRKEGMEFISERVETEENFLKMLREFKPDLILSDYSLPHFDGMTALRLTQELAPTTPFILVTGSMNEETAVECMKAGAADYIIKDHIIRIVPSIKAAFEKIRVAGEKEKARKDLKESEGRYRSLFERVPVGLYRTTSEGQVLDVNPALVRLLGYPSREAMMTIHVADGYGDEKERTRWQTLMEREGVVRGAETQWRRFDGTIIWVRESALAIRDNDGRITHYEGVVEDVTGHKQAEETLQKSLQQTKKVLEEIVGALSSIVERRDPYTAGHQRRVAELACAIAGELNLPEVQIEGIRVAGVLHDIGKINVPAEILSKTGRLSDAEFNIVKTHSQIGKEILESIDFPWPVAQIVHQHHERLNGTGYPQGLSDGKIILEAKIMAVADVVEAMASHRPYRLALGIEKALEEISSQRGLLYDPQAVDACRELFDKKGYKLA